MVDMDVISAWINVDLWSTGLLSTLGNDDLWKMLTCGRLEKRRLEVIFTGVMSTFCSTGILST